MKVFESAKKKEKELIMINDVILNDEVIFKVNESYRSFPAVKKINFCESGI